MATGAPVHAIPSPTASTAVPHSADSSRPAAGNREVSGESFPDREGAGPVPASNLAVASSAASQGPEAGPANSAEQPFELPVSYARLPVGLIVAIPVREFRVRNLLAMAPGAVIETQWAHGEDLPLSSGDVQLGWSEFEVVDTRLAVRLTRLA